jgi:hypothetical protein
MLHLAACISPRNELAAFDVAKLVQLAKDYYPIDFVEIELLILEQQLNRFDNEVILDPMLQKVSKLPGLSKLMAETGRALSGYDLVFRVICLILSLGVVTATAERVLSAVKLIKTRLRTTMGAEYLQVAMILYVQKDVADLVSNEEIIQEFCKLKCQSQVM